MDEGVRTGVLAEAVRSLGRESYEAKVYRWYQGRNNVQETDGIVTDAPAGVVGWAVTVAGLEAGLDGDQVLGMVPKRTDRMGRSTIYY